MFLAMLYNEYFSENEVRNPVSVIQGAKNMAWAPLKLSRMRKPKNFMLV